MPTTWKEGDMIQKGDGQCKILGVCGQAIFRSTIFDLDKAFGTCAIQQELEAAGWSRVEPKWEPTEDEWYYYLMSDGILNETRYNLSSHCHPYRKSIGNCFPYTEEGKAQAEAYKTDLIAWAKKRNETL